MSRESTAVNVVKMRQFGGEPMPTWVLKKEITVDESIMTRSANRVWSIRRTSIRSNEKDGGEDIVVVL